MLCNDSSHAHRERSRICCFSECLGNMSEAQEGGPIAMINDGDVITIDAETNAITLEISEEELLKRKHQWEAPELKVQRGVLYKYAKTVSSASKGCVTDEF